MIYIMPPSHSGIAADLRSAPFGPPGSIPGGGVLNLKMQRYKGIKHAPLTPEEIDEKVKDVAEEMQEVLKWRKEEEEKLKKDNFKNHQSKSACRRALKKAKRRVDSVTGTKEYWKNRKEGMSHFRASIELNEYWASLKEKAKEEREKLPEILKK